MKVNLEQPNYRNRNVTFEGYKPVKTNYGDKEYQFNFPFDDNKYDCYVEFYKVKNNNGNYVITQKLNNEWDKTDRVQIKPGQNKIDLSESFHISDDTPFAYHYVLTEKSNNQETFHVDAGDVIDNSGDNEFSDQKYNLVMQNGTNVTKGGSMKLLLPDSYNIMWQYNENNEPIKNHDFKSIMNSTKTFANKMGGSLAGIEKDLDDGKFKGLSRIIASPIFTDDSLSSHAYWNKNCMQMAQTLGNINNYASMQKKLFANGINLVTDGAFVNEGLEGIHFKHVLKWGDQSPFFYWFKASGINDGPLSLGVFSENPKNVSYKIVNSPFTYTQKTDGSIDIKQNNPSYNNKKPTYIQIFDKRNVTSDMQKDTTRLIENYDKYNTENPYEINSHKDTVMLYHFEIDPKTFNDNVKKLSEYNKELSSSEILNLYSYEGARFVTKFKRFDLEDKIESRFNTWDANTDIAKLNFVSSNTDAKELKLNTEIKNRDKIINKKRDGNLEVQDYVVTSGRYWTRKTNDILNVYVAQNLKTIKDEDIRGLKDSSGQPITKEQAYYQLIMKNIKDGKFPEDLKQNINAEVVSNVINDDYKLKNNAILGSYEDFVLKGMMEMPLDSLEFGDDISAIFASSYMSKRATTESQIGQTRYEAFANRNPHLKSEFESTYQDTDSIFTEDLYKYANGILRELNKELPADSKLYVGVNATKYGKYVLPLLSEEIAKFAIIKSLQPKASVDVDPESGEVTYDYKTLKTVNLRDLKIIATSPKNEAVELINKIKGGIKNLSKNESDRSIILNSLKAKLKNTDYNSFALAEMIVDRTSSGLDWRIDASKDIADIDSMKNKDTSFEDTWEAVTGFWKKFTDQVVKENPNAYLAAEVTDESDFHRWYGGAVSRFDKDTEIFKKLMRETGMTTSANYKYFFTDIPKIFSKGFDDGKPFDKPFKNTRLVFEKMIGEENYLRSNTMQSLLYSYNFISNHDKPRPLDCMAMDMELFYANLNDKANVKARERAYKVLENDYYNNNIDPAVIAKYRFDRVSPKSIAKAEAVRRGFIETINNNEWRKTNKISHEKATAIEDAVCKALQTMLRDNKFLNNTLDADAFGVKPYDINIKAIMDEVKYLKILNLNDSERKSLEDGAFRQIIEPAIKREYAMFQYLVALPGNPTMYAGDDLGMSGYETKTKNIYLQNRNALRLDWIDKNDPDHKPFIKEWKEKFDKLMAMRSRPELHALNDGAPYTLELQKATDGTDVSAILRQSADGAMAISLFNQAGTQDHDPAHNYSPPELYLESVNLTKIDSKTGLAGGLTPNTKFVNANDPNDKYFVREHNGKYFLKKNVGNGEYKDDTGINIKDTTLVLYHDVSFTGKRRHMYNPKFHMAPANYNQTKNIHTGSKLSLTSR